MPLSAGTRLGPYEVQSPLGAGGMGEVYQARDTKLNRDVALKVLPENLAGDLERMARFRREAQVLASLNHSNIAAIYGIEDNAHTPALIMELVEGLTLADRIARGPISAAEAIPIARQIADALEYAHEKGVTHRDLKPANIKITPDGKSKVLDFGLAKVLQADLSGSSDPSSSPTFTGAHTLAGMILGTAAYMSPEQAKGKIVDRRTDIWAFGCVLYEMLTGGPAFDGETVTDTLAAIVRAEPDWSRLPSQTPSKIRDLLLRCLRKDARQRLQSMGDVRIALDEGFSDSNDPSTVPTQAQPQNMKPAATWILTGLLVLAIGIALAGWWKASRLGERPLQRFELTLGPGESFNFEGNPPLAISPDGTRVAYAARRGPVSQIFVRSMDRLEALPLAGTEGAIGPFFSPDGKWIGFAARGRLMKVPSFGGPVVDLCAINNNSRGASWGPDGNIYASLSATLGLMRVSASGGDPQPFTTLDPQKKERTHRWPQVLPDGKTVLFTVGTADSPEFYDDSEIDAVSIATGKRTAVLKGASMATYVPTGHLVYARGGQLFAVPFDASRLQVTGTATPIVPNVAADTSSGAAFFSISNGDLVYISGPTINERNSLAWVDRSGALIDLPAPPHHYRDIRLSPDGQRVAVVIAEKTQDVWIYDIGGNTLNRLTFEGQDLSPIWTPDGKRIIYQAALGAGLSQLKWIPVDGSGPSQALVDPDTKSRFPVSVSPDGKFLSYEYVNGGMMLLPLEGEHKPIPISSVDSDGLSPTFSPDGRWIAYVSNQNANLQVFVQPYPPTGGRWQVSIQEGNKPRWSNGEKSDGGKQLFYVDGKDDVMAVSIDTQMGFKVGTPRIFFKGLYHPAGSSNDYAVTPDGRRIIVMKNVEGTDVPTHMVIALNWFEELQRLAATSK
jgi:serine/threonine protein kinase/Tol biopolymer transport system component